MKFNNRLEAMRWMVLNPDKRVSFDTCLCRDFVWVNSSGCFCGKSSWWERGDAINIRTADHKEPVPEINWTEVSRVVFNDAPLYANILNTLQRYNYDLMKVLEAKFEAKK